MTTLNAVVVDSAIALLRVILQAIDIPLGIFQATANHVLPASPSNDVAKTIVVVGGNFAGLSALKYLKEHNNDDGRFKVVLIDQRSYSEYTPGILRLFCVSDEFSDLAQPLPPSSSTSSISSCSPHRQSYT